MKTTILLALAASLIFATSCGKKSVAQEAAEKLCNCPATKESIKLEKELDGKSNAEKEAAKPKLDELEKQGSACLGDMEAKIKALPADQMAKFPEDFEAAVTKQCPDIAKAMNGK